MQIVLDLHKDSIDASISPRPMPGGMAKRGMWACIGGDLAALDKALRRLFSRCHRLHVGYEAGRCGYVIWR